MTWSLLYHTILLQPLKTMLCQTQCALIPVPESLKCHAQYLGKYASSLTSYPIAQLAPPNPSGLRLDMTSSAQSSQTPLDHVGAPSSSDA